jgi:hypothetical protein
MKQYCDNCSKIDSNRQRQLEARVRALLAGRERIGDRGGAWVWVGRCTSCGERFEARATQPHMARCARCRRSGRGSSYR